MRQRIHLFYIFSWILHYVQNDDCDTSWILYYDWDDERVISHSEDQGDEESSYKNYKSLAKSSREGLFSSIIMSFFFLLIHFKRFSRSIASNIVGNS